MTAKKRGSSKRSAAPRRARPAPKAARRGPAGDPGAAFCKAVDNALNRGAPQAIGDETLRRVLTPAVQAYAAKAEDAGREIAPFLEGVVTATETVVAACAMIRAADLNLFDVAMWFRRPVNDEHGARTDGGG